MADEICEAKTMEESVSEAKVEETADGPVEEKVEMSIAEQFDLALERLTSKLWDERSRNKSKGKRKRLSKDEERNAIALLLGALGGSQSENESLEVMAKKFMQLVVENKTSEGKIDELMRRCSLLVKDKEDLTGQYKKSRLALTKLESLCRELQKHNRLMKEECDHRTKAEEVKRQELSSKFQSSIGEITNQMQDNHAKNQQLKTDNAELTAKLKGLVDQYEMREQYVDKVIKHKQVENQLLEAKLAQQTLILNEEKEQALREKQLLLQESLDYQKKCEHLAKEEAELKLQLSMYTEKFEEFQKTLTKSNEVFGTFKKEMDKMTKTIKKLEKETMMWKQKWEKSNQSLLEIAGDNSKKDQQLFKIKQKNDRLEKLCRALQIERRELSQKLESNKPLAETSKSNAGDASPTSVEPVKNSHHHDGCCKGSKPEAEQVPIETNCDDETTKSVGNPSEKIPTESETVQVVDGKDRVEETSVAPEHVEESVVEESVVEESVAEGVGHEQDEATEDERKEEDKREDEDATEDERKEGEIEKEDETEDGRKEEEATEDGRKEEEATEDERKEEEATEDERKEEHERKEDEMKEDEMKEDGKEEEVIEKGTDEAQEKDLCEADTTLAEEDQQKGREDTEAVTEFEPEDTEDSTMQ